MKMPKVISGATQADADIANALDPPVAGVHVGTAIPGVRHVVIPPDFAARIAAGQDVPGCNYHKIQPVFMVGTGVQVDTVLVVSDAAQTKLAIPAEVSKLPAPLQAQCSALATKLASGTVVVAAALDAQTEAAI